MAHFPNWIDPTEGQIINRLLSAIIRREGLMMRVFDGEEWATEWTRDRAEIQRQTAQTDHTRLYLAETGEDGAARRIGSILLIHGNGEDVVSDYSWNSRNAHAEELIEQLCEVAA